MIWFIIIVFVGIAVFFVVNARTYTKSELINFAMVAGFSENDANTAAAIALAESSGNAHAYNPETEVGTPAGQGSFGLWQIYLYKHPQFFGLALYDPQVNANAAYEVWQSEGFGAWATYGSGAYRQYL